MLTRRNFLRNSTRGVTAAGVVVSSAAALWSTMQARADSSVSKEQAGYKPSPNGSQSCAMCKNFKPPSACNVVSGDVAPQGWCKLFVAKG